LRLGQKLEEADAIGHDPLQHVNHLAFRRLESFPCDLAGDIGDDDQQRGQLGSRAAGCGRHDRSIFE
jgi:hypothetical protein